MRAFLHRLAQSVGLRLTVRIVGDRLQPQQLHLAELSKVQSPSQPVPRLYPWLILCGISALCIDFGHFHRHHDGDSLIPVLNSLYHWTLFLWEQDRFGSLLPMLALPVRQPFGNLMLQTGLGIFLALATFFLLPRYVLRDRTWPLVGALGAISFLLLAPEGYRFSMMQGYVPNFTSLALGLGGLILTEKQGRFRTITGLGLIVLAHWVHVGGFTIFIPLVLARAVLLRNDTEPTTSNEVKAQSGWARMRKAEIFRQLVLVCLSTLVGIALTKFSRYHGTSFGLLPVTEWLSSWSRLAQNCWRAFDVASGPSWPVALLVLAGIGVIFALRASSQATKSYLVRIVLVLGLTGLANAMVIGSMKWIKLNDSHDRYWLSTIVVFQTGLAAIAVWPMLTHLSNRTNQALRLAAIPVLLGVAIGVYGIPSVSNVRSDIDRSLGSDTAEIIDSGATHVFGDFWDVWPAVYHANMTLRDQGSSRKVWGIAAKSWPTRKVWIRCPAEQMRIAQTLHPRRPDMTEYSFQIASRYLNSPNPLVEIERRSTIRILQPRANDD